MSEVPAVLKFLKFQKCPEIWNCPEISLIWQECREIDLNCVYISLAELTLCIMQS